MAGDACPYGHPYDDANTYVDTMGRKRCRRCNRERMRRWRARRAIEWLHIRRAEERVRKTRRNVQTIHADEAADGALRSLHAMADGVLKLTAATDEIEGVLEKREMHRNMDPTQILNEALSRVVAIGLTLAVDLGELAEVLAKELYEMGYELVEAARTGEPSG